jgi:hypothetical protein
MKTTWNTDDVIIRDLIEQIQSKELGLPQFQRPPVWTNANWVPFLLSLLRGRPTGTLLLLQCSKEDQKFAPRELDTAPKLDEPPALNNLILDGQQRLTTLYRAFVSSFKTNESQYVIKIKDALDRNELIDDDFELRQGNKIPVTPHKQAIQGIISLPLLYNESDFENWKRHFVEQHYEDQDKDNGDLIRDLDNVMGGAKDIGSYKFPVLRIHRNAPLEVIVDIFESMNRRGQRLNPFDLMVARLYQKNPDDDTYYDLRSNWQKQLADCDNLQLLGVAEDDGMLPLQLIAKQVSRLPSPNAKIKGLNNQDVLELDPAQVTGIGKPAISKLGLQSAVKALEDAAELLVRVCGVRGPQLLPQQAMLLPIADQFLLPENKRLNDGQIRKWFFCAAFRAAYHGSSNSYANRHCDELRAWAQYPDDPQRVPKEINEFTAQEAKSLNLREDNTRENGIIGRGVMALLVMQGALDWTNDPTALKDATVDVDIHHMVPKRRLKSMLDASAPKSPIAGLTPIAAATNKQLRDDAPYAVLDDIDQATGRRILETHHVEKELLIAGYNNKTSYNKLLKGRETELRQLIIRELDLVSGDPNSSKP